MRRKTNPKTGKHADGPETTLITHRAFTVTVRTPSVWPHCLGKNRIDNGNHALNSKMQIANQINRFFHTCWSSLPLLDKAKDLAGTSQLQHVTLQENHANPSLVPGSWQLQQELAHKNSVGISGFPNGGTVPYKAIFCGDIPLHGPYIGLIYGRYLQSIGS